MDSSRTAHLKGILAVAEDMKSLLAPCPSGPPPVSLPGLDNVDIQPATTTIDERLLAAGIPQTLATRISNAFLRKVEELHQATQESMNVVISQLSQHILPSNGSNPPTVKRIVRFQQDTFEQRVRLWENEAVNMAVERKLTTPAHATLPVKSKRSEFNYDYVPLLEHYFAENPLPTHADKNFLAKKCGMTFRQIHVWFQNRRNRTRKQGQVFKRKPQNEPGKLPLDTLIAKMPHSIIPEDQRVKYVDSDASEYEWQYDSSEDDASGWKDKHPRDPNPVDVFDRPAPPYAFPAIYPPESEHEPFPRGWKASFPPPQWDRRPAKVPAKRPPPMNFEEFIQMFSRMSVKEAPRKHWRKKIPQDPRKPAKPKRTSSPPPKPDHSAATIFITTKPLAAPLAAFVRPTAPPRRFLAPALPTVPAPASRKRAFASPDPTSTPTTLVATPLHSAEELATSKEKSSRRKVASLPRRVPNGTSIAHRATTPAVSNISVSSSSEQDSPSPSSRTPSSGSASSKRIRLSSDSSTTSEIATPEASSLSLPANIPPPVLSMAGFDFNSPSTLSDLFCNSPADSSHVEGLQLDFPSGGTCGAEGANKAPLFDFEQSFSLDFLHAQS